MGGYRALRHLDVFFAFYRPVDNLGAEEAIGDSSSFLVSFSGGFGDITGLCPLRSETRIYFGLCPELVDLHQEFVDDLSPGPNRKGEISGEVSGFLA